ncbi:hypothetical protein F4859DRAFT_522738 [Xylaria cf. heliscus]|nr:hypothetical protein F4859DRAFT_522738 [Xylaria cf. heliscus]
MGPYLFSRVDLSHVPLAPPPPGEVSNFVDPPSISWSGRLAIYLTLPLALAAMVLRTYVRMRNRQLGADDYLLISASVVTFGFNGTLLRSLLDEVLGRHAWDIPVSAITPEFFKESLALTILYSVSAILIKVSVLVLCLRIFHPSRVARMFIWIGITIITLFYVVTTAVSIYFFVPHDGDGGWGSPKNNARSGGPSRIINVIVGLGSALSDYYVLVIPISIVLSLHLPLKRKIGVACIFLLGLLSAALSTAGFVYRYQAFAGGVRDDNRWLSIKFEALSVTELNIGIVCASMPVAFVLFRSFAQRTESNYKHLLAYVRSRVTGNRSPESGTVESAKPGNFRNEPLPQVPKGTLSGLVSFIRKSAGSQPSMHQNLRLDGTLSTPYVELTSIDYDYHAQIRQGQATGSKESSSRRPK